MACLGSTVEGADAAAALQWAATRLWQQIGGAPPFCSSLPRFFSSSFTPTECGLPEGEIPLARPLTCRCGAPSMMRNLCRERPPEKHRTPKPTPSLEHYPHGTCADAVAGEPEGMRGIRQEVASVLQVHPSNSPSPFFRRPLP